jgi:hypothetical protein
MGRAMLRGTALALVVLGAGCLQILDYPGAEPGWNQCTDGVKDVAETDVDCGGGTCPGCGTGKNCVVGGDCESHVCSGGTCLAAMCKDGVKNGEETDVDCGGPTCTPCGFGEMCKVKGDCKGGLCIGGTCAATCTDGVKDGQETGTDCGGPTCPMCPDGMGCAADGDCQSGICQTATCATIDVWSTSFDDDATGNSVTNLAVAVDGSNDVLLAGEYNGTLSFGQAPLTSGGMKSNFCANFDASGKPLWSNQVVGSGFAAVAADATGDVYLTGAFVPNGAIGETCGLSNASQAMVAVLVAKTDATGALLWCKAFGTSGPQLGTAIVVDSQGNSVIVGPLLGTADFGGGPLTGTTLTDSFVLKLDPSGNYIWAKAFVASGFSGVAVDGGGDVILVGSLIGSTTFGGPMLVAMGSEDLCLAKLDSSGNYLWSQSYGAAGGSSGANNVAIDAGGNMVVAGGFTGVLDFGGNPLTAAGTTGGVDVFVAKLGPTGTPIWSKSFGDSFDQQATHVALDAKGQPVVVGTFASSIDFGGGTLTSTGGQAKSGANIFVAKFDAAGNHLWSRGFGGPDGQAPTSLAVDSTGAAVLAGTFNGTIDFGGNPMMNPGGTDLFLAKLRTPLQ